MLGKQPTTRQNVSKSRNVFILHFSRNRQMQNKLALWLKNMFTLANSTYFPAQANHQQTKSYKQSATRQVARACSGLWCQWLSVWQFWVKSIAPPTGDWLDHHTRRETKYWAYILPNVLMQCLLSTRDLIGLHYGLYMDDMFIIMKIRIEVLKLKAQLNFEFSMKNLGLTKKILGMDIHRDFKAGKLWLTQGKYIEKIL